MRASRLWAQRSLLIPLQKTLRFRLLVVLQARRQHPRPARSTARAVSDPETVHTHQAAMELDDRTRARERSHAFGGLCGESVVPHSAFREYECIMPQVCANPQGCISGGTGTNGNAVPVSQESWCTRDVVPRARCASEPERWQRDQWFDQGTSNYHAMILFSLTKRMSRGLSFKANYTYGKAT